MVGRHGREELARTGKREGRQGEGERSAGSEVGGRGRGRGRESSSGPSLITGGHEDRQTRASTDVCKYLALIPGAARARNNAGTPLK